MVNAFLLVLTADRQVKSARYEERAREEAVSILARNNISLDRAILPRDMVLAPLTVSRDPEAEAAQAAALVGAPARLDAETQTYLGPKGTVKFYTDGEFSALLHPGAYPLGTKTAAQVALDTLRTIGFEGVAEGTSANGDTVTVRLHWEGAPVFVSVLTPARETTVTFRDGSLTAMEGYRLIAPPQKEGEERPLSVVTILLRLLAHVKENGDVCREITQVSAGYTLSPVQSGHSRLVPTWHIVTDTREYYLNAMTGAVMN